MVMFPAALFSLTDLLKEAAKTIVELGAWWVYVDTPALNSEARTDVVSWVWSHTLYVQMVLVCGALMVAGAKLAWENSRGTAYAAHLGKDLIVLTIISACGVFFIRLGAKFSDVFAQWIVRESGDISNGVNDQTVKAISDSISSSGVVMGAILAIIVIVFGAIQNALMSLRGVALIILAAFLPISASLVGTKMGNEWLSRNLRWILAFLLYKPVAATIYALSMHLLVSDHGSFTANKEGLYLGIGFLIAGALSLPALMKMVSPPVSAAMGASSGGAFGGVMAGTVLARGAIDIAHNSRASAAPAVGSAAAPASTASGVSTRAAKVAPLGAAALDAASQVHTRAQNIINTATQTNETNPNGANETPRPVQAPSGAPTVVKGSSHDIHQLS
jgi:hypothetical protein